MIDELLARMYYMSILHANSDEKYRQQALTAIYEIGLEVIGKDYPAEDLSKGKHTLYMIPAAKNEEKARMRKAWAKACGVEL